MTEISQCYSELKTSNLDNILRATMVLFHLFGKYEYQKHSKPNNPMDDLIEKFFPTLLNTCNFCLNEYKNCIKRNGNTIDAKNDIILQIIKRIYRIFDVSIHLDFPSYLKNRQIYSQWLDLFVEFLNLPVPTELCNVKNENVNDNLKKLEMNSFGKTRKWVIRCVQRLFQLYGRAPYVSEELKEIAQFFKENYCTKFFKLIYDKILNAPSRNEFMYDKTLAAATVYVGLSTHNSDVFKILLENNGKMLDNLLFNCLFGTICLSKRDLFEWKHNPIDFASKRYSIGMSIDSIESFFLCKDIYDIFRFFFFLS